jgi:hypothetical protein
MRILVGATSALFVAVAIAACANSGVSDPAMAAAASSERGCFYAPHVRGFRQGPGDSIVVNSTSRDYYVLQPYHRCGNLNVRMNIAVRSRGSNYICEGYDADLYVPGNLGYEYCPVRLIRKLTPAEITALRASRR